MSEIIRALGNRQRSKSTGDTAWYVAFPAQQAIAIGQRYVAHVSAGFDRAGTITGPAVDTATATIDGKKVAVSLYPAKRDPLTAEQAQLRDAAKRNYRDVVKPAREAQRAQRAQQRTTPAAPSVPTVPSVPAQPDPTVAALMAQVAQLTAMLTAQQAPAPSPAPSVPTVPQQAPAVTDLGTCAACDQPATAVHDVANGPDGSPLPVCREHRGKSSRVVVKAAAVKAQQAQPVSAVAS